MTQILQLAVFFFTEQILGQLLSFDAKLVLSVYRLFFLMPNVDFINHKDFKGSIKLKEEPNEKDLTTMMRHYIRRLIKSKENKYGLNDPVNLKLYFEFETSILSLRHIELSKDDLVEIINSELGERKDSHSDLDSLYSTRQ